MDFQTILELYRPKFNKEIEFDINNLKKQALEPEGFR